MVWDVFAEHGFINNEIRKVERGKQYSFVPDWKKTPYYVNVNIHINSYSSFNQSTATDIQRLFPFNLNGKEDTTEYYQFCIPLQRCFLPLDSPLIKALT